MTLIKTSVLSAIATIIQVISGFIVTKVIAVYVGPAGLAIIGQLQNFINLVLLASGDFFKTAITKYTAQFQDDEIKKHEIWSTAIKIAGVLYIVVFVSLFFFSNEISAYLLTSSQYGYVLKILAFSIPFFVLNGLLLAILNGQRQIKQYITLSISLSIVSLVLVAILSIFYALEGALVAYVINQSVVLLVTLFYLRKESWLKLKSFSYKLNQDNVRKILGFGAISFTAVIASNSSMLYIRDYISTTISLESAGHWQAIWILSTVSLSLITTSLVTYLLPTLSSIKEKHLMSSELKKALYLILPIASAISLSMYLLRDFIIEILYTKEFLPMGELFLWQMIGNVIKACAWLFGYLFVAKAMVKYCVSIEIIFALMMVLLSVYFVNIYGLVGVTYAYALNTFLYLITGMIIYKFKVKENYV
ncbi:O-antigen translocase [Aliarcobacter butzleri]|uniref:O-antigen translocase n=1 Tax=Aliarcobacter butzleri TaxID=28197 RepID=A0AAW7QA87_9BACT|nr:O-antigen translocase [Aliarcobacter butzleri]MDN5108027.1 O-antigen translocase [Aliarcobacter butzleri]MDN5122759.1 O-antigen translocase [Aliarcobacter butzleri]